MKAKGAWTVHAPTLSPAWVHILLVGTPAEGRVGGWLKAFQDSVPRGAAADRIAWDFSRTGNRLWIAPAPCSSRKRRLTASSRIWVRKRRPTGDAFEAWQRRFLATHQF